MPLQAGDRLGLYEIIAPIGAGGMGEVYRARDTKLDREVAIKVLPAALAHDPERLARFEREAKVLASLNHPSIAQIYRVEERALVMELVQGQTLKGPLPLETALEYAKKIAEALEAAHEKGIIHRDLKPANVMVTPAGVVKVLDFGLAAVTPGSSSDASDPTNSPTLTMGVTESGVIMGTAAYMSPEQASGKPVDKRADIWSFGVVLWEMLTGQRLFHGETTSHTLADVLRGEIDFNKLPRETPAKIRDLLRRCLDRNVKNRLRDIGEARVLLEGGLGPTERPISGRRFVLAWAAAALILALAVAALAFVHFRETTAEPEIARFQILPPENQTFVGPVSVSPDGRRIAYITNDAGRRRLWVRAIDALDAQAIADVDAVFPFWSPDNRFIAYGAQGKLRKSSVSGGPPFIICDLASVAAGGWNRDGVILIDDIGGIKRVSADGGVPSPVTALDAKRFETWHRNPTFLPDGRHFIFLRSSSHPDYSGIYVSSLEDKPEAPGRRLVATRSAGTFVPSEHPGIGFLLFLRNTTLMAQRFDYRRMEMIGEATPIVEGVGIVNILPVAMFSASTNVVAYRTNSDKTQLAWYTRDGKVLDTAGEPDRYADLALSPDGTREAFDRTDPGTLKRDLWIFDLSRRVSTRLTFHPGLDSHPVWSPDSEHIAFHSIRDGPGNLYQKAANGAGEEELLFKSNEDKVPDDWSSDGRFLMYAVSVSQVQIFVLPLAGDRHPVLYLANQFANGQGKFSPDHRWVAYRSNESGENEVYVQSFPANSATGGKWKVSSGGGLEPRWRKDGKELFYRSGRKLMAVDVATTPTFKLGVPKVLFEAPFWPGGGTASRHYAVTADGQKFLINAVPEAQGSSPITVVMNWTTALNK